MSQGSGGIGDRGVEEGRQSTSRRQRTSGRQSTRRGRLLKPEEHIRHGLYTRSLPSQEMLAVVAENIQGLDEEICGLHTLARGLLHRQAVARSTAEAARIFGAYSQAAGRLAELIKTEQKLAESGKASPSIEA